MAYKDTKNSQTNLSICLEMKHHVKHITCSKIKSIKNRKRQVRDKNLEHNHLKIGWSEKYKV